MVLVSVGLHFFHSTLCVLLLSVQLWGKKNPLHAIKYFQYKIM